MASARRGGMAGTAAARWGAALALAVAMAAGSAQAQWSMPGDRVRAPVLLELFTAQGCAACPPADAMMMELSMREDVIALSLHVDYWDYIGWADVFADPEHGERQKRYARRQGHSTIYTPQVVVNGVDVVEGFRTMRVMEMIAAHAERPPRIDLSLSRQGDTGVIEISARMLEEGDAPGPVAAARAAARPVAELAPLSGAASEAGVAPLTLHLVRYTPRAQVEVLAGENAGRLAQHANIVRSWEEIGSWDPSMPLFMSIAVTGDEPTVVIIQEAGQGEVMAAARLR